MRYTIDLTATAVVSARVSVEADNEAQAQELAMKEVANGNVSWSYQGVEDGTEQVTGISER